MLRIPFTKAHGAQNDFLLTWESQAGPADQLGAIAEAICHRHTGVGADGWLLVGEPSAPGFAARIRLFNPDGGEVEISGNGTRCAAAFVVHHGRAAKEVRLETGAGPKSLELLENQDPRFQFEMDMDRPVAAEESELDGRPVVILNVGNPQCALLVDDFDFDWRKLGREIEHHARFARRTNVSFIRVIDRQTLEVRFWERGVGETASSGTGSTGAFAAARLRGLVDSAARVNTPGGELQLRWHTPVNASEKETIYLKGPAELTVAGEFYFSKR
mgnify:CR=1 FL=1